MKQQFYENGRGKIIAIAIVAVAVLAGASFWFLANQKAPEGAACVSDSKCESGLKCVTAVCSSQKAGSPCISKQECKSSFCVNKECTSGTVGNACLSKSDCAVNYCVNSVCSEGKKGDACATYQDCKSSFCVNNECASGAVGSACLNKSDCAVNYCVNGICSDGKKGSMCLSKDDCFTKYCVENKCADGKNGDACATYKDCDSGLLCQTGLCATLPDYSKYFSKVVVSKMKAGLPPGPDNIPVPTTEFKNTDGIEIDFVGVKPTLKAEFYYEFVNAITGEVAMSTVGFKQQFSGSDRGTGTDLRMLTVGAYDLNIYVGGEMAYTTQIKIVE